MRATRTPSEASPLTVPRMSLKLYFPVRHIQSLRGISATQSSGDRNASYGSEELPAEQFAPVAAKFRRRLLIGVGSASLVAVGANFGGVTSFVLGLSPEIGRQLKLDVLYPIGGYSRCIDPDEGFEFMYPETWVGDQRLLYSAAERTERRVSLDPPPLDAAKSTAGKDRILNGPVVAFGPPGSSGELNVSVIVSRVPLDFSIETFGDPNDIGEAIVRKITSSGRRKDVKGTLIRSNLREDSERKINYYELEFSVDSPSFRRHNVAVCCVREGKLYTLNAQAPESGWPKLQPDIYAIADSFSLIS